MPIKFNIKLRIYIIFLFFWSLSSCMDLNKNNESITATHSKINEICELSVIENHIKIYICANNKPKSLRLNIYLRNKLFVSQNFSDNPEGIKQNSLQIENKNRRWLTISFTQNSCKHYLISDLQKHKIIFKANCFIPNKFKILHFPNSNSCYLALKIYNKRKQQFNLCKKIISISDWAPKNTNESSNMSSALRKSNSMSN